MLVYLENVCMSSLSQATRSPIKSESTRSLKRAPGQWGFSRDEGKSCSQHWLISTFCAAARWRKCATTRWSEPGVCLGSRPTRTSLGSSEGSTLPSTSASLIGYLSASTVRDVRYECLHSVHILLVCVCVYVSQRRGGAVPECSGEEKRRSSRSLCQRGAQRPGAAEAQAPYGEQIHWGSLRE